MKFECAEKKTTASLVIKIIVSATIHLRYWPMKQFGILVSGTTCEFLFANTLIISHMSESCFQDISAEAHTLGVQAQLMDAYLTFHSVQARYRVFLGCGIQTRVQSEYLFCKALSRVQSVNTHNLLRCR